MLLACPKCHRQYDVGSHAPGAKVRCLCGTVSEVGKPRARQVEMLHCSNCGGKLEHGKRDCPYCSAQVKLADRGLGPSCPECFATTLAGAKHCGACGVRLEVTGVLRALSSSACPRCKSALTECETDKARYVECTGCAGLWLDEALLQRVTEQRQAAETPFVVQAAPSAPPVAGPEQPVRYLCCPVCGEIMSRRNFAHVSGVILDWCRGHGWWFDAHELERVLRFLESGGMEKSRRHELELEKQALEREERRRERKFEQIKRRHRLRRSSEPDRADALGGLVGLIVSLLT